MVDQPSRTFSPLQTVNFGNASATSTGNPFESIAQALQNASNHVQDRLDINAQIEGKRAGALAGLNGVPTLQDDSTIRGRAFNISAMDTAETQFELKGLESLSLYEKEHEADPTGFTQKADNWYKGIEQEFANKGFDPAVGQKILANYKIRQTGMLSRIEDRAKAIARDKQLEGALNLQLALQDDLQFSATQLFSPTTSPEQRSALLQQMISSGEQLTRTAHQMGADGRFLFDATQRVKLKTAAESAVSSSIGTAWLNSQGNMIDAYHNWENGKAAIDLPDGNGGAKQVPLRDLLGPTGYKMAQDEFFDSLKSNLALQSQVDAAADRAFKKKSDDTFVDLAAKGQDGSLDLKTVETAKGTLEPDHYLALREVAKGGGASVSDGRILSDLIVRDANGEDVRPLLRNAFAAGQLSREDYFKYYNQNSGRLQQGMKDPIDAGRDSLAQRLGVLSKELGLAQSSAIGQASLSYEQAVSHFVEQNQRQPNINETSKIAEEVYSRFSAMDVDSSIISLPLPRSMTQAEKLDRNLTSAVIQQKINKITADKLAEVGGDKAKLGSDPEYVQEITNLKKYFDLLKLKETKNGRQQQ